MIITDYIQAIEVLTEDKEPNWREIGLSLAKEHPDLFVKLARRADRTRPYPKPSDTELMNSIHWNMATGLDDRDIVAAIKALRAWTDCSLKDAKDAITAYEAFLFREGLIDQRRYEGPSPQVPGSCLSAFNQLIDYTRDKL